MELENSSNAAAVLAKEVWRLVRVLYLTLRKNISKTKFLLDLTKMMKRRKITAAGIFNLISHHHNHNSNWATNFSATTAYPPPGEYEFSCTNSPAANPFSRFTSSRYMKQYHNSSNQQHADHDLDILMDVNAAVRKMIHSETASPVALPGFGRTPLVRQLRVTDSPFPLSDDSHDSHVDDAAEEFINRFYNDLRRQNINTKQS